MSHHRLRTFIVAMSLLAAGTAGAIDLTGSWTLHGFFSPPGGSSTTIVQTGGAVTFTVQGAAGPLTGTIDSATGAFTVTGADPISFSCAQFTGTASADGNFLDATVLPGSLACGFRPTTCNCIFATGSHLTGCRTGTGLDCCGDLVVGPGELCDAGPNPVGGCCDGSCQPVPAGTACVADADVCTVDVCNAGACTHPPTADTDGDGVCDAADECPASVATSRTGIGLSGFTTPVADDRLTVRGTLHLGASPVIDPVAHGLRVRLDDGTGTALVDVTVPPGAWDGVQGWKAGGRTFRWRSPTPAAGIVTRAQVTLSARAAGDVRVTVSGRSGSVTALEPPLPLTAAVVLDPPAPGVACAELRFSGPVQACRRRGRSIRCR